MIRELKLPSPLPKCYYAGASEDGPVIVLDDLSHRGLKLPSLKTDIPESDVQSILRSLAIVQVASLELQLRRKKSMVDLFPFLQVSIMCYLYEGWSFCSPNQEFTELSMSRQW